MNRQCISINLRQNNKNASGSHLPAQNKFTDEYLFSNYTSFKTTQTI